MKARTAEEIRTLFLKYFEKNGHQPVPSSSTVPAQDPTLLFTNAGMNQFKSLFLGEETRDYSRAVSVQKCVRAGGKHNDLENVGRTARHQTFFEMLGNFSFGDYFKKDAIEYAWEFVTKELKLPKSKLYVTVFHDDDEAYGIWEKNIGIDPKRISKFGEKDNYWSMGDVGPCGPCSEIFYDQGKAQGCGKSDCAVGCECDRYIEFWNLVFMEFEQKRDGSKVKLPNPSIDTGMGLERIAMIVQGQTTNYDTDLFVPILNEISSLCGVSLKKAKEPELVSMRVIADHIRAMTFLITDGVLPSNEGRGYVLRRIMRRAMRHGRKLGLTQPFLFKLSEVVVTHMGSFYSELKGSASSTAKSIEEEERRFEATIDRGLSLLMGQIEKLKTSNSKTLSGATAFQLYDTYGFPVDLTADVLREHDLDLDQQGFDEAFALHREKARGSWKGSDSDSMLELVRHWAKEGIQSEFHGYSQLVCQGKILKIICGGKEVSKAQAGSEIEIVADQTVFYGESGGQVGDIGGISGKGFSLEVVDTKKPSSKMILHKCRVLEGEVSLGAQASFEVNAKARAATARNHTATHMLHALLRSTLGDDVKQAGSLVSPERLRFDFTYSRALTDREIQSLEYQMNEKIWTGDTVAKNVMPMQEALDAGAVALFDEKYGDEVRVISFGNYSMELCGGTHLESTSEIGMFKIVKEGSVSSGVRRIEAFTGYRALRFMQDMDQNIREASRMLGSTSSGLSERIEKLVARQKEVEKELKKKVASSSHADENLVVSEVNGVRIVLGEVEGADHQILREIADRQLEKIKSGVVALGSKGEGKAFLVVKVSKDLSEKFPAGKVIKSGAKVLGGSGGGRGDMAQAGGPDIEKLDSALKRISEALQ